MKEKIKEALRQEYKSRLELDDDRLDGVAAFAATFVTDESKIEEFVKSDATLAMLKSYQSILDKDRAKRKPAPAPKQEDSKGTEADTDQVKPDIADIVAKAVAAAISPLQEKLTTFETAHAKETAVAALDKFCAEWDYAGGYPKERDEAKRIALKVYKAGGEQMNGEQLIAAFREEFDPAVKSKGVTDFSKPYEGDGGSQDAEKLPDMEAVRKIYEKSGRVQPKGKE